MSFKRAKKGLSSLLLFAFLLIGCFFNLNGQNCYIPTNVVTNNITATSATLQWDAMPNATAYEVNYRPMNAPSTQPWSTVSAPTNTATINALTPSTMYDVQVRSACGSDFSDYTVTTSFSTQNCVPPFSPIVSNLTANSADIQWTAVPGASGYQLLYRIAVSDGTPDPWTTVSSVNNTYTLTGLTANTLYAGRLVTDCGGFPSDTSKVFYFSTNPCSVPSNLLITAQTASSVSLAWDAVTNANQYNVQYRTAGNGTWTNVNTNTNSRTINGLTGNTAYEFRLRSNCGGGVTSAYTLITKGFTLPCAMPENAIISNVTVNSVTVSWNNAIGSTQYKVEYREVSAPIWTTVNANNTTKTITNLQPDTDYEVKIRSKCSGNQYSAFTDSLKFRTKSCRIPTSLRATNLTVRGGTVLWSSTENATAYRLAYKAVGDSGWTTVNVTDTFKVINNLLQGALYEVKVCSRCAAQLYSDYSPPIYLIANPCITPVGFEAGNVTASSAQLMWDSAAYVVNYRVEYKTLNDSNWTLRTVPSGQTQILLNNLIPGIDYYARITTNCGNGVVSPVWDTLRFATETCIAPQFLYADTVSYQTIILVWDNEPNLNYSVEHREVNSNVWTVRNTTHNRLRYTQLNSGSAYWFRVRSRCGQNGWSPYSNEVLIQTLKCKNPILYAPDTLSPTSLRLKWSSDPLDRYLLSYKRQTDTTWQTRNVNDTIFTLQNIVLSENYQFLLQKRCTNNLLSDATVLDNGNPPNRCNQADLDVKCGKLVLNYGSSTIDPFQNNCTVTVKVGKELQPLMSRSMSVEDFDVQTNPKQFTSKLRLDQLFTNIDKQEVYDICISFPVCGTIPACTRNCEKFVLTPDTIQVSLRAETDTREAICSGSKVRLIASIKGTNFKNAKYQWQGGGVNRNTDEPFITVYPTATTTYTVSVYDLSNTACVYTASVVVNVNPKPVITSPCPSGLLCKSNQPYTQTVSWTPAVNAVNDVQIIGEGWSLVNDLSSGTISFTPRTAGTFSCTLRVRLGECVTEKICSLLVLDSDFRMPELKPCYQSGESVNLNFSYPPNDLFNVQLVTWLWSGSDGSSGSMAGTYEGLTLNVPALNQTTTYTVSMRVGNTACITERVITLNLCGQCQDDCTIQITPQPEPCYSARVQLCAPAYNEHTQYSWRYINPSSAPFAFTRCITIDVPFEPGNRMIEVTAMVPGANGQPNQTIVSALPVNQLVYPRGINTVPFNVNTASALLAQLNSAELIDPQALNGAGYPNNVQGTLFFPTLNNSTFTVDRNLTLRNMRIVVGGGIRIVVPAGVTLTMDNCYLHSINGTTTFWDGILVGSGSNVSNPGRVIFNGVTMEHSLNGITNINRRISNFQEQGSPGLIWVDNSCLNENRRHIDLEYSRVTGTLWENLPLQVIRTIPTPLVLRNTVLTCIDPLPGTANDYTDQALRLRNIVAAQVGADVTPNAVLPTVQLQLLPPPAPLSAFPTVFNSAGWLNPNRITRADVGIVLAQDISKPLSADGRNLFDPYYINNNIIGNLIDQQSQTIKSVGIDILPLIDRQNRRVNNSSLNVFIGTLLTGYNINDPNNPTNRPSNDFAIDPTIFQSTTPLPLVPTRMDYGIRTRNSLGLFSTFQNRYIGNCTLQVRNNRFRNIGVQNGVEAVVGIHSRYPRYTTWMIENNRFQDIEYGTWVAEQVASAGFNNQYTIDRNYFFRFKCGTVFYSNNIASPFNADHGTIRGRIHVNFNTFEEYVNTRQDNSQGNQPNNAPIGWHDGGIIALGPLRPADNLGQPIPNQPDLTIEDNRFIGNQQSAIILVGESPSSGGSIRRNIVAPNTGGYTGRTCKIGIQSVVSVRLNIEDNDIDLGNTNPSNMINNYPDNYTALGGLGQYENPNAGLYSSAFWLSQTQGPQSIACNRVKNGAYGFDVRGDCVPGVNFRGNLMKNLNVGVMFRKETGFQGQLGIQGSVTPPATSNYNVWDNNIPNQTYTWDSDGNLTTFVVSTNDIGIPNPYTQNPGNNRSNGSNIVNVPQLLTIPHAQIYGCQKNRDEYFNYKQTPVDVSYPTEERIARGDYQYPNLKYDLQQRLMTLLSESGNEMIYRSAVLDSFYKANQNTAMAGFIAVERLLDLKPETARLQNESLVPINQQERNQQTYYRLYLSAARNEGKLSAGEYTELVKIAEQCPNTGGKAVNQARLMRFNLDLFWHSYPECGSNTEKPILKPSVNESQSLSLYPNPAMTSVHVLYDVSEESAKVIFYNVMGVAVYRQDLSGKKGITEVETRNWASGIYTAKIIGRNGENLGVSKLVIVK